MEAKLWRALYRHVTTLAHPPRRPRERYADPWVLCVLLWSALHDKPVGWACEPANWPAALDDVRRPLPSGSTMSRRLRTVGVLQLLERLLDRLASAFPATLVRLIDSKPLLVGAYSKDRDAKRGRLADGLFARGYRLHALARRRAVRRWTLARR